MTPGSVTESHAIRRGQWFVGLFAVIALGLAFAWGWIHESLPALDGEVRANGLAADVEVLRDGDGIPHLFAKSERDGAFALGYVHAQDRLWQMEFQRRIAQGRLSEFLGERAYDTDRLFRTLGIQRQAGRIAARLDRGTLNLLEGYAAGVNAFLDEDHVLPIEFQAFRIKPEHWKPADSVAWLLVMAWDLSANWRTELARMRFAAKLGRERAAQIIPPYPGDPAWIPPDLSAMYAEVDRSTDALLAAYPPLEGAVGSNNWVVSGARSETGKPLLANDPHLGLQAPALWYLAHVSSPVGNAIGGTLPGVPFVVLGRTDRVAWSMTTTLADTEDLFVERLAPGDPGSYVTPKGTAKFEVREEVIRVGDQERRIKVRSTRHGPVLSDAVTPLGQAAPKGYVLALQWAALSDDNATMRAGFEINRAKNQADLIAAARDFHAPAQNVVYADADGHIGFIAPAKVPVRRADNELMGRVPSPGWNAKYDWQGFLPFEQLPMVKDPPAGKIVTANNKITPPGYKPFISVDWFPPYRSDRIEELLAAKPKHSVDSFARIQADTLSRLAREFLPIALAAKPETDSGRRLQQELSGWNGEMAVDARAPLVFAAWYRELTRRVYEDDLGPLFRESWDFRLAFMSSVMKGERGMDKWCDDVRTPAKETCAMQEAKAFDVAAQELERRYGADHEKWRWGAAHFAAGDHRPFGFFPVLGEWFNVSPQTPGDAFSVDVGQYFMRDEDRPFANRHAPSMRAIYDLSNLDNSLFMQSTGQSGNVLSPWYSNFANRWAHVEYIRIPAKRESIQVAHRLVLEP